MAVLTKRTITDIKGTSPYLVRWSLWLPFGWSIKLHKIVRPDSDRCAHDHPWRFLRIILWGGYYEECGEDNRTVLRKPRRPWAPWRIYWCGKNFRHRISSLPKGYSWTLVFVGKKIQDWGFFTKHSFMQWRKFVDAAQSARILWCDDGKKLNDDSVRTEEFEDGEPRPER